MLNIFFQKKIIRISYDFVYDNEINITNNLKAISLSRLNSLGTERIHGILEDIRVFIFLPGVITNTFNSVLLILLCIGYLFSLSVMGALIIIVMIAIIAYMYFSMSKKLSAQLLGLRNSNDDFNKFTEDILQGFKELKISAARRYNLSYNFIIPNRNAAKETDIFISNSFSAINVLSQYGLYFIFGVILFVLPFIGIVSIEKVVSFIVILLFMSGPINRIITMQNLYMRIGVSQKRIKKFLKEVDISITSEKENIVSSTDSFNTLEFVDCVFHHNSFTLGPVNLNIKKGEVIFIIGGNGSGKSTFINLLTGLYAPSEGKVDLNGKNILNNIERYQNLLSAIFTDNYIFSQNYDNYKLEKNTKYIEYLKMMKMDSIIKNDDDSSVRRKFSKGQSKRVSMILSLLEEKPLLILDEWAADQDPHFRKYFYENLIPVLRKEGKTIVAVTHDDKYFKHADRILKFEYGKIIQDITVKKEDDVAIVNI
ncbi:ATP-binding cassette domain-containing protein [Chryseobacterium pennae]|uniref:ATP-binding cassette domain-containing protein n=1 Tax=Chryseobacterium pennae TaxID=2258962 RepID=UPI001E3169A0|nr:ATP-binding cassette domain-containing protein [Chryseobacterium pennae]